MTNNDKNDSGGKKTDKFKVFFKCRNCGNTWFKTYDEKKRVKSGIREVVVYDEEKRGPNSVVGSVECPVCELRKTVYVKNREPVED